MHGTGGICLLELGSAACSCPHPTPPSADRGRPPCHCCLLSRLALTHPTPKPRSFLLLLTHAMCFNCCSPAMFTFKEKNLPFCVFREEGEEKKGRGKGTCLPNHGGFFHCHYMCVSSVRSLPGPPPPLLKHFSFPLELAHKLLAPSPFCVLLSACHTTRKLFLLARMSSATATACTTRSWSISEDSLRRYVSYASESCIQELLSASESNRIGGNDGWKVLTLEDGLEISKRCSGSLHVFRSRWLLRSVSPQQFMTVANAIDAAKQWDPHLVEANYIKDLNDNLSIIRLRFGDASKPLFKNREFIVYERRETMDDGTLVVAVASLPKEIAAGLQPKKNNSIRGLLLQSGWVVEKMEDDSCMVTYVVQLDPAGWLPKCFVNRLNTKLVMIIDNLKKMAQACPVNGGI